jgi:hypothetical protein
MFDDHFFSGERKFIVIEVDEKIKMLSVKTNLCKHEATGVLLILTETIRSGEFVFLGRGSQN